MTNKDNEITKGDFTTSGWEKVIAICDRRECSRYTTLFSRTADSVDTSGSEKNQQIFKLLRDITSLNLDLNDNQRPFKPMVETIYGRSAIIEDLKDNDIRFLREIIDEISDPELKARTADILYIYNNNNQGKRKDFYMAQIAVQAYLESASLLEDADRWIPVVQRLERAAQIAISVGRNGQAFINAIRSIESLLTKHKNKENSFFPLKLMEILLEFRAGNAQENIIISENLAKQAEEEHRWGIAREYWNIKSIWHTRTKEEDLARNSLILAAETHIKESEDDISGEKPSYLRASISIQRAIGALRKIGNLKEQVDQLHRKLVDYQHKSTGELSPIIVGGFDASEIINIAENHVKEKTLPEAIIRLANICLPPKLERLREQAYIHQQKYIFQRLFPLILINAMGRTIARQPTSEGEELQAKIFQNASIAHNINVQALIEPARNQIYSEHNIREIDFLFILRDNILVPRGRELIIARGLYAGMRGDFLTAVHFLIPQIEASIRYILTQVKVLTSSFDDDGIQDEYNLNRLLSSSEFTEPLSQMFGIDLILDLRGLLIERFGANIRNDMAHGLLDHDSFYSFSGCYLWWISLHFYSIPITRAIQQMKQEEVK